MVSMAAQDKIESGRAMKCALIGCGRIAAKHLEAALINDLEIVALCDIFGEQPAVMQLLLRIGSGVEIVKVAVARGRISQCTSLRRRTGDLA